MVDDRENQDKRKAMVRAMTFQKNIFNFHSQLRQVLLSHHK